MYKVLDLFSGIGGFSLGLERTGGFETVAFCEIDKYAQKVLKKHWPNVPLYEDITELTNDKLKTAGIIPNVITGGFPCQDLSVAGKQEGIEGSRSGLWSELARLISEVRPAYTVVENVPALLSGEQGRWFGKVLGDLAEIGYDAEWHCMPASYVGARHLRDRVWVVAYPSKIGHASEFYSDYLYENNDKEEVVCTSYLSNAHGRTKCKNDSYTIRKHDGFSTIVDRLSRCGNAIVPQIATLIGQSILDQNKNLA